MCLVFAMLGSAQDIKVVVSSLICEIIQGVMMNVVDKLDAMTSYFVNIILMSNIKVTIEAFFHVYFPLFISFPINH